MKSQKGTPAAYRHTLQPNTHAAIWHVIWLQLLIKANSPPRFGNCTVAPLKGKALSTTFRVACFQWTDEDGNYPLTYQFAAYRRGW
jgi:hypothetical protein